MPDASGAPAPKPTSWADYLSRLKLARATRRREDRKHRPLTAKRVAEAETLLARIIDGSDLIAEVALRKHYYDDKGVCLLVTMTASEFRWLCQFGAKLEDDEDDDAGELDQDMEPDDGAEPSLGSQDAVIDQTYWSRQGDDWQGGTTDGEPNGDEEPSPLPPEKVEAAKARVRERVAAGKPEDGPETIRNGAGFVVLKGDRWGVSRWWTEEERRAVRARGDTP